MTPNQLFPIVNGIALVTWILLIVLPGQRWVANVLAPTVMPAAFAMVYIAILATG